MATTSPKHSDEEAAAEAAHFGSTPPPPPLPVTEVAAAPVPLPAEKHHPPLPDLGEDTPYFIGFAGPQREYALRLRDALIDLHVRDNAPGVSFFEPAFVDHSALLEGEPFHLMGRVASMSSVYIGLCDAEYASGGWPAWECKLRLDAGNWNGSVIMLHPDAFTMDAAAAAAAAAAADAAAGGAGAHDPAVFEPLASRLGDVSHFSVGESFAAADWPSLAKTAYEVWVRQIPVLTRAGRRTLPVALKLRPAWNPRVYVIPVPEDAEDGDHKAVFTTWRTAVTDTITSLGVTQVDTLDGANIAFVLDSPLVPDETVAALRTRKDAFDADHDTVYRAALAEYRAILDAYIATPNPETHRRAMSSDEPRQPQTFRLHVSFPDTVAGVIHRRLCMFQGLEHARFADRVRFALELFLLGRPPVPRAAAGDE